MPRRHEAAHASFAKISARRRGTRQTALSRQTLTATCPAGNDNLAATLGGNTCTEAVTALANKLGRLIGTLRHLF